MAKATDKPKNMTQKTEQPIPVVEKSEADKIREMAIEKLEKRYKIIQENGVLIALIKKPKTDTAAYMKNEMSNIKNMLNTVGYNQSYGVRINQKD